MKYQFVSVDKIFICLLIDEDNCPICIVHSLEPCNKFDKLIINSDDTCVIEEIKQKENKESYNGHIYVLSVLTQKKYPLNMGAPDKPCGVVCADVNPKTVAKRYMIVQKVVSLHYESEWQ